MFKQEIEHTIVFHLQIVSEIWNTYEFTASRGYFPNSSIMFGIRHWQMLPNLENQEKLLWATYGWKFFIYSIVFNFNTFWAEWNVTFFSGWYWLSVSQFFVNLIKKVKEKLKTNFII